MFDLSWSHILIFLVVALVVVGPKDMPRLLRIVGQWVGRARAMANEFRQSFDDMARQTELDELRKEIENLRHERPLSELEHDMQAPVMRPIAAPTPQPPTDDMPPEANPVKEAGEA
jgi:sec-independent protein translocase protein TatB